MTSLVPLKALYDENNSPVGISEFQSGEVLPTSVGGTGVSSYQELMAKLNLQELAHVNINDLETMFGYFREQQVTEYLKTRDYINQLQINRLIELEFTKHLSMVASKSDTMKYLFEGASDVWRIEHNRNTTIFEQELFSEDEYGHLSPFSAKKVIIDVNTVEYRLSKSMKGFVVMTFHDSAYENCLTDRLNQILDSSCPTTNTFVVGLNTNIPVGHEPNCASFIFEQDEDLDTWIITRDVDQREFNVFVYDDKETIYAVTPESYTDTEIILKFQSPRRGRAIVYYDDYLYSVGPKFQEVSRFVFTEPQLTWRIEHNLNSIHIECELYSPDTYGPSPFFAKQIIIDANTVEYRFTKPLAGYVNIVFSDIGNKITTVKVS